MKIPKNFTFAAIWLLMICFTGSSFAQTGFTYQAVARDASGNLMAGERIDVSFYILQGSPGGTDVYSEDHENVRTNDYGLFSLEIGNGSNTTGSLEAIDWISDDYFLEVEIDGNTMGSSRIHGAPFAMKATHMALGDLTDIDQTTVNSGDVLTFNGGTWTPQPDKVDDADADNTNEIQQLSLTGSDLSLSNGGGTVTLPPSTDTDWIESGSNVYRTSGNVGLGTASPLHPLTLESSSTANTLHIEHTGTSTTIGKDLIELQVPANATAASQFIEMQSGTSVVASINTDGSSSFKNVRVTDEVTTQAPVVGMVYANSLPVAYGAISGTFLSSDYGISSVSNPSTGRYEITLNRSLADDPAVLVTAYNASANDEVATYSWSTANRNRIIVNIATGTGTGVASNFSFVVFGTIQ